jgi:membrane protease YdiL (CAAX protease family)
MNEPAGVSLVATESPVIVHPAMPPVAPLSPGRRFRDSPWVQTAIFCTIFMVVLCLLSLQLGPLLRGVLKYSSVGSQPQLLRMLVAEAMDAPAAVIALWITARLVIKKPFASYGFSTERLARDAGIGFALGAVMIATTFMVEAAVGVYRITGMCPHAYPGTILLLTLLVGIGEETAFRGFLLQTLEERHGTTAAVLVSSALFGLAHVRNFDSLGIGLFAALCLGVGAGLPLAGLYLSTRRLGMPIAFHWAWDAVTFLLAWSPMLGDVGLVRSTYVPDWLDCTVDLVVGGALGVFLLRRAKQRGQWRTSPRSRAVAADGASGGEWSRPDAPIRCVTQEGPGPT